jgi:hypothetical protein
MRPQEGKWIGERRTIISWKRRMKGIKLTRKMQDDPLDPVEGEIDVDVKVGVGRKGTKQTTTTATIAVDDNDQRGLLPGKSNISTLPAPRTSLLPFYDYRHTFSYISRPTTIRQQRSI